MKRCPFVVAILLVASGSVSLSASAETTDAAAPAASNEPAAPQEGEAEASDPAVLFKEGATALAGDRPTDAIAKLEALGDRGIVDAVVSYDRALAYAARVRAGAEQPGDLGRAAHGFEEARELTHDGALAADATSALTAVRAEVARRRSRGGDPIELEHGVSLGRSIVRLLPENVWAAIAAICALALAAGIVVRARAPFKRVKVAATTTSAVAAGLLAITALVLHSARDVRLHYRDAVVIAPNTRLLDEKRVAITSVAPLPEGARVQLLDEAGEFAHVLAGHTLGWLPSSTVLPMAK